jgi:hypothetical protein
MVGHPFGDWHLILFTFYCKVITLGQIFDNGSVEGLKRWGGDADYWIAGWMMRQVG